MRLQMHMAALWSCILLTNNYVSAGAALENVSDLRSLSGNEAHIGSRNLQSGGTFMCPTNGTFITDLTLWEGEYVNAVSTMTCSDGAVVEVNVGAPLDQITYVFSLVGTGFCASNSTLTSAITQLTLKECTFGFVVGPYGNSTEVGGAFPKIDSCGVGEKANGITLTSSTAGINAFDLICGVPSNSSTCSCSNGVASVAVDPCTKCASCDPGYVLIYDHCLAGAEVECTSPAYITQIALRSGDYVDGIDSVTCSDGVVLPVSLGDTGGTPQIALAGDGTSTSPGFCVLSYATEFLSGGVLLSQLSFTECTTGLEIGAYGTNTTSPLPYSTCEDGKKGYGLKVAASLGNAVTELFLLCGAPGDTSTCSCYGGIGKEGVYPCSECASCDAGYTLSFTSTCTVDVATTVAPTTL